MGINPYGSTASTTQVIQISDFRLVSLIVNMLWTFKTLRLFYCNHILNLSYGSHKFLRLSYKLEYFFELYF